MTELLVGILGLVDLRTWPPVISISGGRLKNVVYNTYPRTLVELTRNISDEINNISRGELQRVMGNFIK